METTVTSKIVFDCEVSGKQILIVPIATITPTSYNPKARTKEGAKLNQLIDEIKRFGLAYPILITLDRQVIDGNRRLAACKTLGYETIECIVSDIDRDEAFRMVNTTAVPIGGKGWLELGRGGGKLPAGKSRDYQELVSLVGLYGIDLLIKQNIGLNILGLCKAVKNLGISISLPELILTCVKHKLTNKFNAILRSSATQDEKAEAVESLIANI